MIKHLLIDPKMLSSKLNKWQTVFDLLFSTTTLENLAVTYAQRVHISGSGSCHYKCSSSQAQIKNFNTTLMTEQQDLRDCGIREC